jgi:hypothetical protein
VDAAPVVAPVVNPPWTKWPWWSYLFCSWFVATAIDRSAWNGGLVVIYGGGEARQRKGPIWSVVCAGLGVAIFLGLKTRQPKMFV